RPEQAMRLAKPRLEEREVVVEGVREPGIRAETFGTVAMPGESPPIPLLVAHGAYALALLHAPRVEGRVEVDEIHRRVGQRPEHVQTFSVNHPTRHARRLYTRVRRTLRGPHHGRRDLSRLCRIMFG